MRDKILIVGSSSKVAQAISETLTNNGLKLIGTYNKKYPQNPECYENLIKINFNNQKEIKKLKWMNDISDIIFTIGKTDFLNNELSKVNYETLKNLLDYLKIIKKNIRIIFCSSSAVYGDNKSKIICEDSEKLPSNSYGKSKLNAENILIKSKNKYIIIRFPIVLGVYFREKFSRFIKVIEKDKLIIFGKGENNFSFIHQNDLSEFVLEIIKKKDLSNNDFNIVSGNITQKEYLSLISNIFNKKIPKPVSLSKLFKIVNEQLEIYDKKKIKPALLKEDIISLSRDRKYNMKKSIRLLKWKPQYNIIQSINDTFKENNLLSRWNGIKILEYLYQNRLLPVKIYRNPLDFNTSHFKKNKDEIWSVTIRDEMGDIINTDHLFSRDHNNIKRFMIKNKRPHKVYIVRLSPPKEKIDYYGSFLIDKKNFGNKINITISKKLKGSFIQRKEGESFKILPRDFVPDFNLVYKKKELQGNFLKRYSDILIEDIDKLKNFLYKTKRESLTIPVLFIISNKEVRYISLGL